MKTLQYLAIASILSTVISAQNIESTDSIESLNDITKLKKIAMKMGNGKTMEFKTKSLGNGVDFDFKDMNQILIKHSKKSNLPDTYLGVPVTSTDEVSASQLGIASGLGLSVISKVDKESPAGKSGIIKNDILYKLNDQLLVNKDQLMTLLSTYKVGDKVMLSYYRSGKLAIKEVTLEKRISKKNTHFKAYTMGANDFDFDFDILDETNSKVSTSTVYGTMIHFVDQHGRYILNKTDKGLHLNAKDNDGKELFNGLIDSEKDSEKIPAKIQPSVEKMKALLLKEIGK